LLIAPLTLEDFFKFAYIISSAIRSASVYSSPKALYFSFFSAKIVKVIRIYTSIVSEPLGYLLSGIQNGFVN